MLVDRIWVRFSMINNLVRWVRVLRGSGIMACFLSCVNMAFVSISFEHPWSAGESVYFLCKTE